jgi:hypothetical protein
MIYRNVVTLVVRVMAADTLHDIRSQSWQSRIDPGEVRWRGSGLSRDEMKIYDCWMHARLHGALAPEHWAALTARYSTHVQQKVHALEQLEGWITSPAPGRFRERCIATWGFPKVKGAAAQKRSIGTLPAAWYDMSNWDDEIRSDRTRQRWASGIRRSLDARVDQALLQVQIVCDAEGIFEEDAA